jgi:hypothetical protein
MNGDPRNCTNMVTGGVEYTFLVDGAPIPDRFKLKDYYIVRLSNFTYRIFKKVQTETEKSVLRRWNADGREYLNLSWIPKGCSPDSADQWVSGIRFDSSMAECKAEDGQILYALPNDFDCLGAAEENLRLVDGLLKIQVNG